MIDGTFLGTSSIGFQHNPYADYADDDPLSGGGVSAFGGGSVRAARMAQILLANQRAQAQQEYQQQQLGISQQHLELEHARLGLDAQKQAFSQVPVDEVWTGHDSQKMQQLPDVMGRVPVAMSRYMNDAPAPFMRIGNQLYDGYGKPTTNDQMAQMNQQRSALTPQDRVAMLQRGLSSDPTFAGLDGLQRAQVFMHATGIDPLSYEDRGLKQRGENMDIAVKLQQAETAKRDALQKEYGFLATSAGGHPEDILASFGRNAAPGHANEYFNPGRMLPPDGTGEERQVPGGWRGIDPGTVERMRQIRATLGYGTQAQPTVQSELARQAYLTAKASGLNASPSLSERSSMADDPSLAATGSDLSFGGDPTAARAASAPSVPAAIRAHNYLFGGGAYGAATGALGPLVRKGANFSIGMANTPASVADFVSQLMTGQNQPVPMRIPYIPQ